MKKIDEQILMQTPEFDILSKTFDNSMAAVTLKTKPAVCTIAFDMEYNVVVVQDVCAATESSYTTFPYGEINEGEEPTTAAIRVLNEKTGIHIKSRESLYLGKPIYLNPQITDQPVQIFIYLKEDLTKDRDLKLAEGAKIVSLLDDKVNEALKDTALANIGTYQILSVVSIARETKTYQLGEQSS